MQKLSAEENEAKHKLLDAIASVCLCECHKRCPPNQGHCDRCKHCDVQFVFSQSHSLFKINSEEWGLYPAFRELYENEHRQDFSREY